MTQKKPYAAPKITEVELNQEQAILSTCASGTTSTSNNKTTGCVAGTCKKSMNSGNNAGRAS